MNVMKALFPISICIFIGLGLCASDGRDLFSEDGNVLSLSESNLYANIFNQERAILAIFYAHWCGHCLKLSHVIKDFAQQIRHWKKLVQVVAIDCPTNINICSNLEINEYPRIYLLAPKTNSIKDAQLVGHTIKNEDQFYEVVRDFLVNASTVLSRGFLTPIYVSRKEEICNTLSSTDEMTNMFVIIENNPSTASAELILDLLTYRKQVHIQRFYGGPQLINSFNSVHIHLPAILEVRFPCSFRALINPGQDLIEQKHQFVRFINGRYPEEQDTSTHIPHLTERTSIKVVKYKLSYTDLYNTLRESLLVEIPKTSTFNETHVTVIKQYFSTILKYFPFRNENVRRLFKRMNIWLGNKSKSMKAISYREAIRISDGFLKPMESWRHCNGSKPYLRGYPCGLWILFHTLTVNEYNIFKNGGTIKHDVMSTMRNYVKTFLSCEECARHFVQATAGMENELIYPNSSVMFLWRIHNQVNHRLQGEPSEDPCFLKIQFPSKKMCDNCVQNNQFDISEVFSFLTSYYSKKSIQNGSLQVSFSFTGVILMILVLIFN